MAIQLDDVKDLPFGEVLERLRDSSKEVNKNLPEEFARAVVGFHFRFDDGFDVAIQVGKGAIEDAEQ